MQNAMLFSWNVSTAVVRYLYETTEFGKEFLDFVIWHICSNASTNCGI